jgi:hypothetical protein
VTGTELVRVIAPLEAFAAAAANLALRFAFA